MRGFALLERHFGLLFGVRLIFDAFLGPRLAQQINLFLTTSTFQIVGSFFFGRQTSLQSFAFCLQFGEFLVDVFVDAFEQRDLLRANHRLAPVGGRAQIALLLLLLAQFLLALGTFGGQTALGGLGALLCLAALALGLALLRLDALAFVALLLDLNRHLALQQGRVFGVQLLQLACRAFALCCALCFAVWRQQRHGTSQTACQRTQLTRQRWRFQRMRLKAQNTSLMIYTQFQQTRTNV
mmetsp:Transcript_3005/g.4815  ORF Transcript_3005/g.4815 Transcript_3005/m.4815 type:complete len:239 (+) Transcript_3005:953-1669(+)